MNAMMRRVAMNYPVRAWRTPRGDNVAYLLRWRSNFALFLLAARPSTGRIPDTTREWPGRPPRLLRIVNTAGLKLAAQH